MRLGTGYVDARDPTGRLLLANGVSVDVHSMSRKTWGKLQHVGVKWLGAANLSRFVNKTNVEGGSNVTYSKLRGDTVKQWITTKHVHAHEELLASSQLYGPIVHLS